jgi:hypothetical protein
VTYRVRFEAYALVQLHGLPREAFDALLDRVVELVDEPWDAVVMPPGNDPAYRQSVFGSGWDCYSLTKLCTGKTIGSVGCMPACWTTGISFSPNA